MALVAGVVTRVNAQFVDRDNNKSNFSFNLPGTMDVADIETAAAQIIGAAAALSDAVVPGYTINRVFEDVDITSTDAPESSDVERKGVFYFTTVNGFRTSISIPSISNTVVLDGTQFINTTLTPVITFEAAFINTTLGAGNSPVTTRGEDIVARADPPKKVHRASQKG